MTHHPHNRKAFTLLELVLVLVIITIVVGMASPQLRFFVHGQGVGDTATQIVALTRWARSQAITESTQYRLNINSNDGTFWVTTRDAAGFHPVASSLGRVFHVPQGVRLDADLTADQGAQYATFYPDGRTDPGTVDHPCTIRLIDGPKVIRITCPSATEDYRVVAAGKGGA
jgi:prepilin-type N-terminal cleavage/methylation domain-containing protein